MTNPKFLAIFLAILCLGQINAQEDEFLYDTFPDDFLWGLATSAYQIEGAAFKDGNLSSKRFMKSTILTFDPNIILQGKD